MLCERCSSLFEREVLQNFRYKKHYPHLADLRDPAAAGCFLCRPIWDKVNNPWLHEKQLLPKSAPLYCSFHWDGDEGSVGEVHFSWGVWTVEELWFEILPYPETSELDAVHHPNHDTGHESSFALIEGWLLKCSRDHEQCRSHKKSNWRPKRLVDISLADRFRVVLTDQLPPESSGVYMTLSHCWGKHMPVRLLTSNSDILSAGCDVKILPKTFQDAIHTARRLKADYLWIDSLCIVQDSPEDWRTQSATMDSVYQYSYLNIAATSAANSEEGMFVTGRDICSHGLKIRRNNNSGYALYALFPRSRVGEIFNFELQGPLLSRGWVVQEQLFPTRVVHFDKRQVQWRCRSGRANETWACLNSTELEKKEQKPRWPQYEFPKYEQNQLQETWHVLNADVDEERIQACWEALVCHYSDLQLTNPGDKLVALSGLATAFLEKRKTRDDSYLAGLFRNDLPRALMWNRNWAYHDGRTIPEPISYSYRAPSWSWASIDYEIRFPAKRTNVTHCEVLDSGVVLVDERNVTGQVLSGFLRIRAPLFKCTFVPFSYYYPEPPSKRRLMNNVKVRFEGCILEVNATLDRPGTLPTDLHILLCFENQKPKTFIIMDVFEGLLLEPVGQDYRRIGMVYWRYPFTSTPDAFAQEVTLI